MSVLVAVLALMVSCLYVTIALVAVPRLARVANQGEPSKAIAVAAVGAGTFLLGCAVTHFVIAYRELDTMSMEHATTTGDVFGHVVPHIAQLVGGIAFLLVARSRFTVYVVRNDDSDRVAELEGRLSLALDAGHLGAWDVDLLSGRTWCSVQHDRIFGYQAPPDSWDFDRMLGHVIGDHREMVRDALELGTDRPRTEVDCQIVGDDGSRRWITVTATLLFDSHGQAVRVLGTVADITDRRQREEQRAVLEEQLHNWQRVEAVGRLASEVAHDFNNVLTVVHGWAEVLDRDATLTEPARSHVRAIRTAADHGHQLTQQLVGVTRQHAGHQELVDVNDSVHTVTGMLQRLVPGNVHVRVDLADVEPVLADPTQVTQILLNLAINARDAMPTGGNILFATRRVEGNVVIQVSDDGVGMDDDTMARIFEPYFTTKAAAGDTGTGLGLSIVQSLVKRAGGTIEVRSAPGAGTRFTVTLPAASGE